MNLPGMLACSIRNSARRLGACVVVCAGMALCLSPAHAQLGDDEVTERLRESGLLDSDWADAPELAADAAISDAWGAVKEGRYDEALEQLGRMSSQHPSDPRVPYMVSIVQFAQGHREQALTTIERAIELQPLWPQPYWALGSMLAEMERLDEADQAYSAAVQSAAEDDTMALFQRARFRVLFRGEDMQAQRGAIEDLTEAGARGMNEAYGHLYAGLAQSRAGSQAMAERHLREARVLAPADMNILAEVVSFFDLQRRHREADSVIAEAAKSATMFTPDLAARFALIKARHAITAGMSPRVIEDEYMAAVERAPHIIGTRLEYARWLETVGRNCDAVSVLEGGLQAPPYNDDLAAQLAWALTDCGRDLDAAAEWLRIARVGNETDPYLADTAAWIEYRSGAFQAALAEIQKAMELANEVPEVAFHAGAIYAKLGERERAASLIERALQLREDFTGAAEARRILAELTGE